MANITLERPRSGAASTASSLLLGVRQLPMLPVAILTLLLVTAIFADLIAPHSPTSGNLRESLLPPFWMGEKVVETKIIVDGIAGNLIEEISLGVAQTKIESGDARVAGGGQVVAGSDLELLRRGGSWDHILGQTVRDGTC